MHEFYAIFIYRRNKTHLEFMTPSQTSPLDREIRFDFDNTIVPSPKKFDYRQDPKVTSVSSSNSLTRYAQLLCVLISRESYGAIQKCQHFHECTKHTLSRGVDGGLAKYFDFCTLSTFWSIFFIIFMALFGSEKMLMCTLFERGEAIIQYFNMTE